MGPEYPFNMLVIPGSMSPLWMKAQLFGLDQGASDTKSSVFANFYVAGVTNETLPSISLSQAYYNVFLQAWEEFKDSPMCPKGWDE